MCSLSLKPSISERTPERAERMTTLVIVYKYGFADNPDILKGLSNSCKQKQNIDYINDLISVDTNYLWGVVISNMNM